VIADSAAGAIPITSWNSCACSSPTGSSCPIRSAGGSRPNGSLLCHVPPTLVGVLQAQLDGLPAAERELLQHAAVVGRRFWDAVLAVLAADRALA